MRALFSVPVRPLIRVLVLGLLSLPAVAQQEAAAPTPEEAAAFIADAEARLLASWIERERREYQDRQRNRPSTDQKRHV